MWRRTVLQITSNAARHCFYVYPPSYSDPSTVRKDIKRLHLTPYLDLSQFQRSLLNFIRIISLSSFLVLSIVFSIICPLLLRLLVSFFRIFCYRVSVYGFFGPDYPLLPCNFFQLFLISAISSYSASSIDNIFFITIQLSIQTYVNVYVNL